MIVTAVSFYLTKKKEREAHWRKYKYEQYKEFMVTISVIGASYATSESHRAFAKSCNILHLIGSRGVLDVLHAFQNEIKSSNPSHSAAEQSALLSKLVWEVRKDIEIPGTTQATDFTVKLWGYDTSPKK